MASMTIAGMGVTAMLGKIATGTMAVVEAAAKYDSLQVRLKGIEGGAKGAAIAFDRLQELSKLPGLGFEQAADAYAGLRSLRQDGPEAIAIIEAFARANQFPRDAAPSLRQFIPDKLTVLLVFGRRVLGAGAPGLLTG